MTSPAVRETESACLLSLEAALDTPGGLPNLSGYSPAVLERALQLLVKHHGAGTVPLLRALADRAPAKAIRKAAKRAIYRLAQAGIALLPSPGTPTEPVVRRRADEPVRAWLSGIDGTGSRAVWILFEGGLGGQLRLCSLILNDEVGILESAGGSITRKRLEAELRLLREHQKLPWVETDPRRACALVGEALALHARVGTDPPAEFSRWRPLFAGAPARPADDEPTASELNQQLLDRSVELLELPELAGWFVDPGGIHEDTLALLQARESRLVLSDRTKADRETAIVDAVIDKQFTPEARRRWARRLAEMALIFRATDREETARLAGGVAVALADDHRSARHIPFVRALAMRGLEMGAQVALGRAQLAEVSRAPTRKTRP